MAPREEPVKIETRTISNRGLIRWEPSRVYRRFWFNCQVIRLPRLNFLSKKINPDRSEYAQITFLRKGVVLREERLNFSFQTFTWEQDPTGYLANSTQCWFEAISSQIATIQAVLGIPVIEGEPIYANPIFDQFDSVRFVVRPDAAIRVDFWALKYDENCGYGDEGSPPPPPPPDSTPVPPGTPVQVSPPYRYPDDNNNTQPLPEDELPEPPPQGGACIPYSVTVRVDLIAGGFEEFTVTLFGEFEGAGVSEDGNSVFVRCRGGQDSIDPPAGECLEVLTDCFVFGSSGATEPSYSFATIVNIVEI